MKEITDFQYIRFHAIFHDEVGVYDESPQGKPIYNFSYVDQIYDGLLERGVRPFVEIGFMPRKLAFNPDALHPFWYKPNVSPPKSLERWGALVARSTHHDECRQILIQSAQAVRDPGTRARSPISME